MTYWQDKVVAITGGAAGLGRRLATHFGRAQARLVLIDYDDATLAKTSAEFGDQQIHVTGIQTDITRQADVDAVFARIEREQGRLDALVNCAGRSARGAVLETSPDDFEQLLQLNFYGTVRCTRAAAPALLRSRGHLVNIGSLAAKMAARYLGAYPVSKFAVAAYTQQLRLELAEQGLHVMLVCPGPIARPDAGQRYDAQTDGLPAAARKPGGGARIRGLDPDDLARRILRACERRQPELVIPWKARALATLTQLFPRLGDRIINRMTR